MMGAIIGDIVGSVYEWNNIKTKEFPLFQEKCFFTDDSVMTIAVAEALMKGGSKEDFVNSMHKFGRMYPNAGYGARFGSWLFLKKREPYNSWGNGSAMRVSPVGFWTKLDGDYEKSSKEIVELARLSAEVTHNHPEGVKGACATAESILFMRFCRRDGADMEESKRRLRELIQSKYGYDLSLTLDEIRPTYKFNESCQETVPQAIEAFLESSDFEDAIRNAISLGGDSDTLAAITGGIAEAAYEIPDWIIQKAWGYLTEPLRDVCRRWKSAAPYAY